jgi:hypothetical protein
METSSNVPAYNGELRSTRGRVEDNTVGSLTMHMYCHDPVTTDPSVDTDGEIIVAGRAIGQIYGGYQTPAPRPSDRAG